MKKYLLSIIYITVSVGLFAQTDSLSLQQILKEVLQNHPSVKEATEALNVADTRIAIARSENLPMITGDASYAHIGPVSKIDFGGRSIQLSPDNSYNASVSYNQVFYNFGKTEQNVKAETESKNLTGMSISLLQQKLSMTTVNSFFTLVFIQEAIKIKEAQIQTLKEHVTFLEKKSATGSATRYELLSSKVKLSGAESQMIELKTIQQNQSAVLNSLLGLNSTKSITVKTQLTQNKEAQPIDTLINFAFAHRAELAIAREKETLALLQQEIVKKQNNASINGFATAGAKNGYMPDLNSPILNYVAGVSVRVPIYDGNRKKNNLAINQSQQTSLGYETEIARRNISTEVIECETNCESAAKKLTQYELQLEQATEAYNLAKTNFAAGAITNLDLLDAETSLSECRLLVLKSKIDYELNFNKLQISIGKQL